MVAGVKDQPSRQPLQIGLVGTGFAANARALALAENPRAQVAAVTSHSVGKAQEFAQTHEIAAVDDNWQTLVRRSDLDVVVVCTINRNHSQIVRAALEANKSVVVEYPLALSPTDGAKLIALAEARNVLLHVEHIELLGGLHQAMQAHLSDIGTPWYVRYSTAVPQESPPQKWTYHTENFGFPLIGALSRIHRLTNLFGAVASVTCQLQYDSDGATASGYFQHCRCVAQLKFQSGLMAEILYAKGNQTWRSQRCMEVEGDRGALIFDGDQGSLITREGTTAIEVGGRRGLFARDTEAVLDALLEGKPLYVTPQESLYALQVAAAAEKSAESGNTETIEADLYPTVGR